jgi:hypothetical protein
MRMIIAAVIAGLIFMSYSCNEKTKAHEPHPLLGEMSWLIGTWKSSSPDGEFYEIWNAFHDSAYKGIGFMLVKGDTLFSEIISLELRGGELYYIPTVSGQNEGMPVSFKLISSTPGNFVFENKQHDFPQRIIYSHPSADSLHARIEGIQEGEFRKEEFAMHREK